LKCGATEGWRSSRPDHARNEDFLQKVKEERNIPQTIKRRLSGLVTSYVGTAF